MEEDAIVLFHHCILFIRATTFIDKDLYCISTTLYTEEDPHEGSIVCICNMLPLH